MNFFKIKYFKKLILIVFLLVTNTSVSANFTTYEICILSLLEDNCVISLDNKAPAYMRKQGKASCFVGNNILEDIKFPGPNPFNKIIKENNYSKSGVSDIVKETSKCIKNPDGLKKCTLTLTHKLTLKKYNNICKNFTSGPMLNLVQKEHGISSNAYEFQLPGNWIVFDVKIQKDGGYKYTFKSENDETIILEISNKIDKEKYILYKNNLKESIPAMFPKNGMELITHGVFDIGSNNQVDEIISYNQKVNFALSQFYIYGKDRIAVLIMGRNTKYDNLSKDARKMVELFKWKTP